MSEIPKVTIIRSRRRTIALQVQPDATLVVKAPLFTPMIFINKFIRENSSWIDKKITTVKQMKKHIRKYQNGELFMFLGKEYFLQQGSYTSIKVYGDKLLFPEGLQFRIKKELSNWYIRQAREIISKQVNYFAAQMKTGYADLTFSDTKSQWGRCTRDNRLQFSWRLVMAPLLVVNYVIVHELAHTFEKNHSRSFWNKVRFYNPSYKQQIKWLKSNGGSLVV